MRLLMICILFILSPLSLVTCKSGKDRPNDAGPNAATSKVSDSCALASSQVSKTSAPAPMALNSFDLKSTAISLLSKGTGPLAGSYELIIDTAGFQTTGSGAPLPPVFIMWKACAAGDDTCAKQGTWKKDYDFDIAPITGLPLGQGTFYVKACVDDLSYIVKSEQKAAGNGCSVESPCYCGNPSTVSFTNNSNPSAPTSLLPLSQEMQKQKEKLLDLAFGYKSTAGTFLSTCSTKKGEAFYAYAETVANYATPELATIAATLSSTLRQVMSLPQEAKCGESPVADSQLPSPVRNTTIINNVFNTPSETRSLTTDSSTTEPIADNNTATTDTSTEESTYQSVIGDLPTAKKVLLGVGIAMVVWTGGYALATGMRRHTKFRFSDVLILFPGSYTRKLFVATKSLNANLNEMDRLLSAKGSPAEFLDAFERANSAAKDIQSANELYLKMEQLKAEDIETDVPKMLATVRKYSLFGDDGAGKLGISKQAKESILILDSLEAKMQVAYDANNFAEYKAAFTEYETNVENLRKGDIVSQGIAEMANPNLEQFKSAIRTVDGAGFSSSSKTLPTANTLEKQTLDMLSVRQKGFNYRDLRGIEVGGSSIIVKVSFLASILGGSLLAATQFSIPGAFLAENSCDFQPIATDWEDKLYRQSLVIQQLQTSLNSLK